MQERAWWLFFNARRRVRCVWRLIIFLLVLLLVSISLSFFTPLWGWQTFRVEESKIKIRLDPWVMFLSSLLVSMGLVRYLDKRPISSLGLRLHPAWWKELLIGISLGASLQLLHLTLSTVLSAQRFQVKSLEDFLPSLLIAIDYFRNAVMEELLFRGFPFQILIEGVGILPAILITSSFFGLGHVQEQGVLGVINAGSGGILMAVAYLKTRALWTSIGIHFAWNYSSWLIGRIFKFDLLLTLPSALVTLFYSLLAASVLVVFLKPHLQMEALWQQYIQPAQPWARLQEWWFANRPKA